VIDAARAVLKLTGHRADMQLRPDMPTGPMNRVADNRLANKLLNWRPQGKFMDGLASTIDWYFSTKDRAEVASTLESLLTERHAIKPSRAAGAAAGSTVQAELTDLQVK